MKEEEKFLNGLTVKEAWKKRRLVIYFVMVLTGLLTMYMSFVSKEANELHKTVVESVLSLNGFLIIGWIFGSSVENITGVITNVTEGSSKLNGLSVESAWTLRRRVIYTILFYVIFFVVISMGIENPSDIQIAIVDSLIGLVAYILMAWIFGAVSEDIADRFKISRDRKKNTKDDLEEDGDE